MPTQQATLAPSRSTTFARVTIGQQIVATFTSMTSEAAAEAKAYAACQCGCDDLQIRVLRHYS